MTFDFSKIKPKKRGDLPVDPVDPVELFQKLKVYDPGINDRCQPRRAKRRLVVPSSREAALLTRRAQSARGEAT